MSNITNHNNTNEFFYFFCEPLIDLEKYPGANTDYQHAIICLAEGLTELGYTCYGNTDYWHTDVDAPYLIKEKTLGSISDINTNPHTKPNAIIVASHWILKHELPPIPSNVPVFLMADMQAEVYRILHLPNLSSFKHVLLAGYVSCYDYPDNIVPWAFGLSNRIIHSISKYPNSQKNNEILFNFRMGHTSRNLVKKHLMKDLHAVFDLNTKINTELGTSDYDTLMARQTGMRHYPKYYETLSKIKAVAGFGGYFASSISRKRFSLINRITFKIIRTLGLTSSCLIQHDSWRLWETLAAGALLFLSDLDEGHVVYPVQPKNLEHYIGVPKKFLRPHFRKDFMKFLLINNFDEIADKGRAFALEHYSPVPTAKRFLSLLQ